MFGCTIRRVAAISSVAAGVGLSSVPAQAKTLFYGGGDLLTPGSYSTDYEGKVKSDELPAAGDTLKVQRGYAPVTLTLTPGTGEPGDRDTQAWNLYCSLGVIIPEYPDGFVVFDIPDGQDVEFRVPISGKPASNNRYNCGRIVKRGGGTLRLTSSGAYVADGHDYDYVGYRLEVEAGELRLPTTCSTTSAYYGGLSVAKGARLYCPTTASGENVTVRSYWGLFGEGQVCSVDPEKRMVICLDNGTQKSSQYWQEPIFKGSLGAPLRWMTAGGGIQTMLGFANAYDETGTKDSDRTHYFNVEGQTAYVGVDGFGAGSPLGAGSFYLRAGSTTSNNHMVLEYLGGQPATFDNALCFDYHWAGADHTISGGTNGCLTLPLGNVWADTTTMSSGFTRFRLSGRNGTTNEVTGRVGASVYSGEGEGSGKYRPYFGVDGDCTWIFRDYWESKDYRDYYRSLKAGLFVASGTLLFESAAETNQLCALGTTDPAKWFADDYSPADYAICLGKPDATVPAVFEFAGGRCGSCSTRPIALAGDAHLRNGSSAGALRWVGARALADTTATLFLDGSSAALNEFADISDGDGTVGVTKDGDGTWLISGDTTFTGPLTVRKGKLVVRASATQYTWYRWTWRGHVGDSKNDTWSVDEMCLWSADGERQNGNLEEVRDGGLLPGQAANLFAGTIKDNADNPLAALFSGTSGRYHWDVANTEQTALSTKPHLQVPIVLRLPAGAKPVTKWDWLHSNATEGSNPRSPYHSTLEGSVDGLHWETLDTVDASTEKNLCWALSGGAIGAGDRNACPDEGTHAIASHSTRTYATLSGNPLVTVEAGATLEAEGEIEVSKLAIDAQNAGTMKGFRLAETGTLDVTGLTSARFDSNFTFDPATAENLANWSVTSGGKPLTSHTCDVNPVTGRLTFVKKGLVIIFR